MARFKKEWRENGKPFQLPVNQITDSSFSQISPWTGQITGLIFPVYTHNATGVYWVLETGKVWGGNDWIAHINAKEFESICDRLEQGESWAKIFDEI